MKLKPYLAKTRVLLQKNVREAHFLFLVISIPAIAIFIYVLPPAWGLDEQVHIARAYQISEGNLYPDSLEGKGVYGGTLPGSLVEALNYGHTESNSVDRNKPFFVRKDIRDKNTTTTLNNEKIKAKKNVTYEFGPTGPYSPIIYAPASIGMLIGKQFNISVGELVTIAKVMQAVVYLVMCFIALWILRNEKARWLIFMLALLPSSIFLASTINADPFTIGTTLLFLATIINFFTRRKPLERKHIGALAITTVLLMFSKPSYSIFAVLLLFLPTSPLFKSKKQKLVILGAILLGSAVVFSITALKGLAYGDSILTYKDAATAAQISLSEQVKWILSNPLSFTGVLAGTFVTAGSEWNQSFIGMLGYNTIATPFIFTYLAGIVLTFAALYGRTIHSLRLSFVFLGLGIVSVLLVVTVLYGTFNPVGSSTVSGVQGRYFIPCVPFILLGLMRILPMKLDMKEKNASYLFTGSAAAILYVTVAAYIISLF